MTKNIDLNLKFLRRLQGENGITEISNLSHNLGGIEIYDKAIEQKSDLYYISFVPNEQWYIDSQLFDGKRKLKNDHIGQINYFKADFDIRSYFYKHEDGRIISNEELFAFKDKLLEGLKSDSLLGSYTAVVYSGNGFHIYRIGKMMDIEPKVYAAASRKLYDTIKKVFPEDQYLWPDYACSNIGRIMRLPGSFNNKKDYGLPPQEVKILEYNEDDSLYADVLFIAGESYLKDEVKKIERQKIIMRKSCEKKVVRFGENEMFHKINEIPIADLVCEHTGRTLAPNGVNFISNRNGNYTGAFLIPEENIVVHMGTPHFSDYFKVYSPFAFIMVHYCDGNARETFERAKELYPELNNEWDFSSNKSRLEWMNLIQEQK